MITYDEYAVALQNLEKKEVERKKAIDNGNAFQKIYNESLELAKRDNKLILIIFHVQGCDGCKVMEYMIHNDDDVKKALEQYIVLEYNVNNTFGSLTTKYNVYSYPTCVIINNEEKVIKQKSGCPVTGGPQNQFVFWLN